METMSPYVPDNPAFPNQVLMAEVDPPVTGTRMVNSGYGNMTNMIALNPSVSVTTPITMLGVGLFGNVIAIGVYRCSCSAHRGLPFYGLVNGLLWTNIMGYLSVYPLIIAAYFNGLKWIGGKHSCNFQGLSTLSFGMSTSLLVGCMGFERFLAVCKPELYAKRVERRKIPYLVCLVWIFAVFTAFMPIVGFGEMVQHYPGTWCFVNWRHQQTVGKLYTSILAAELTGVLLLVFSCLVSVLGYSLLKLTCPELRNSEGFVEVSGTTFRRLSVRARRQQRPAVMGSASAWLTFNYVVFACTVLVCIIPIVWRIIMNVNGSEEDHFATFSAMGFAECFPASAPWIYVLLHPQVWQRCLPCCFSKHLPITRGDPLNYYQQRSVGASRDHNHLGPAEAGRTDTTIETCNNNTHTESLDAGNGMRSCQTTVIEDGSTNVDIARSATGNNQQKYIQDGRPYTWIPSAGSPQLSNTRSNNTPVTPCTPPWATTNSSPPLQIKANVKGQDQGHTNHHFSHDGSLSRRVEYHALVRLMDDDSHENPARNETSELAKVCTFGKESTI